jgi:hypothetical protein
VDPQHYNDLMRHLAVLAEQDPTLRRLQRVLEQDRAIQQMDLPALQDFIARLEAKFGVDPGQEV